MVVNGNEGVASHIDNRVLSERNRKTLAIEPPAKTFSENMS